MNTRIAIVGIGGIFPGARDPQQFWDNVRNRNNAAAPVPATRWLLDPEEVYSPEIGRADRVYSRRACLIQDFVADPVGLDIDEELFMRLDPMFQIALQAGHQAFRDGGGAGIDADRTGVIFGNIALPTDRTGDLALESLGRTYRERLGANDGTTLSNTEPLNRYVTGLPAALLSQSLGLRGTSFTLDAACASSLYALKLACDELGSGRASAMLAGGVSKPSSLYTQMGFSQLHALSPDGRCAPFDANANGLVVGEGAGMFLLKRVQDAERDGDHIYAVLRGFGLSNDIGGRLMAPDPEGQVRAMRAAYQQAGWSPGDVDLIECHATGTPVGDAAEFSSLMSLWSGEDARAGACAIGSVKSNVGHLLTAAGAAGLMKVLWSLREGILPPTANYDSPASGVALHGSPFRVLRESEQWLPRNGGKPRRAAVSAFGFGGINAHLLVEEWQARPEPAAVRTTPVPGGSNDVAIVGLDTHFGAWDSRRAFQERVLGDLGATPSAPERWWGAETSDWFLQRRLKAGDFRGHYLRRFEVPLGRFRIPPRELEEMLPQQLLMLKVMAGAIADTRWEDGAHERCGVFVGIALDLNTTNFHFRWSLDEAERAEIVPALTANRTMGALGGIVASRIAREFRVGGPSITVSSEETSGLHALEIAVRALRAGELDCCLVGAVDLAGDLRAVLGAHARRAYSATGARPFDRSADGTGVGEGAAAVVLKRLDDAERDADRIYAVIRGVGSAAGDAVDAPSAGAYRLALESAYADAALDPATIGYLETHGSGDPLEDAIELEALTGFFAPRESAPARHLGSVKADIGHSGAAAGLAGVAKTALCLYQEVLPPVRGLRDPCDAFTRGGFLFATAPQYWLRNRADGPRRAGVSGLNINGGCGHLVLEEHEGSKSESTLAERRQPLGARNEALFVIEGDDVRALSSGLEDLAASAAAHEAGIERVARDWFREHPMQPDRRLGLALLARDPQELQRMTVEADAILHGHAGDDSFPGSRRIYFDGHPLGIQGEVAFVFPGSGNHFTGMGRELAVQWPEVARRQDAENLYLPQQLLPDRFWNASSSRELGEDHRALIIGQVALGTLVSDLVGGFGVKPQAVLGYSLGEAAGLFALRAWRDREAMLHRLMGSTLFTRDLVGAGDSLRQLWGMVDDEVVNWVVGVVDRAAAAVRSALENEPRVYLLIINTAAECVIGGERSRVEAVVDALRCNLHVLEGVSTVHCEGVRPVAQRYHDLHLFPTTPPAGVRFYSASAGAAYDVTTESAAANILEQALHGFDFPALLERAYADGVRIFLEMGPGSSCSRMIARILEGRPHVARSACSPQTSEVSSLLELLGQLVAERVPVDLGPLYGARTQALEHGLPESTGAPTLIVEPGGAAFRIRRAAPAPRPPAPLHIATPATPLPSPSAAPVVQAWSSATRARADAHESYLRCAAGLDRIMAANLARQLALSERLAEGDFGARFDVSAPAANVPEFAHYGAFAREQCLEFATGSIGAVLGPAYAVIDGNPTRVRLPAEPLMLVDRIVSIDAQPQSLSRGTVVTEHDVGVYPWYLDGGVIPTCIAVEAGQADLFLAGYLGIDFQTRGLAVYRLLDAVVTFHDYLPAAGTVIRYEIIIEEFFQQDDTWLFHFRFDADVGGRPLLTMRDGCAGFFTAEALARGRGVVRTAVEQRPRAGVVPADWSPLAPMSANESYTATHLDALRDGDLAACFGASFAALPLSSPLTLPGGRMRLVDRVTAMEPAGGRFGLGRIRAEADIDPDAWFLTCHFTDDMVMPGTLMYECCLHALRIFLLRMGWIGQQGRSHYEPVPEIRSRLKCRGQVIASTAAVAYEIEIKEFGYGPEPYAIADARMYADGREIVDVSDLSIRLTGVTRSDMQALWSRGQNAPLFDHDRILAFAVGKPSEAFGEPYEIFDRERVIARLPGPPYQFLDRVMEIEAEAWRLTPGARIDAAYDIPHDAWYFEANRHERMAFAVLLEVALQPCGWLAAYLGSALESNIDLRFRNLGGRALQHRAVTAASGTLSTRVTLTDVSRSGGMTIERFDFCVTDAAGAVYEGDTYFGFFSQDSLAQQVGLSDAQLLDPGATNGEHPAALQMPDAAPWPGARLRMLDRIDLLSMSGGPHGLGFITGSIDVDPGAWFFAAHFYQDPVWPGSLGLESMLQLLKYFAGQRWGDSPASMQTVAIGREHRWTYRGQIIPGNRRVSVEAVISAIDDDRRTLVADGYLSVDGRPIYQMQDFSLEPVQDPP